MRKLITFSIALLIIAASFSFAESKRMVLVEEYTSAYCGTCVANNPAFNSYLRNNQDKVIPMVIHTGNAPGDPLYQHDPQVMGRVSAYVSGTFGTPAVFVNGKQVQINSQATEVNKFAGQDSPYSIYIIEDRSGTSVSVNVIVEADEDIPANTGLTLGVIEEEIHMNVSGSSENEFWFTARKLLPGAYPQQAQLVTLKAGERKSYPFSFQMHQDWDPEEIFCIAFIQNYSTKEVLQAARSMDPSQAKPSIAFDLPSLNFGSVSEGKTQTLQVTNNGLATLNIDNIVIENDSKNAFELLTSNSVILQPFETYDLQVRFDPQLNMSYSANMKIYSNASNGAIQTVVLSGKGSGIIPKPVIVLSTDELDFGTGAEAKTMELTVSNTGVADLEINTLFIWNNTREAFSVEELTLPLTVAPDEEVKLNVTFNPPANDDFESILKISSNASNGDTKTVVLKGTGEGIVSTVPEIQTSSNSLNFGNVSDKKIMSFDISNIGGAPLEFESAAIESDNDDVFDLVTDDFPTLQPDESMTVEIQFTPKEDKQYLCLIKIKSNADNSPSKQVALVGIGSDVLPRPFLSLDADELDYGTVSQPTQMPLELSNSGFAKLLITSIEITGADATAFSVDNDGEASLEPDESLTVNVTFNPGEDGDFDAELTVHSNTAKGIGTSIQIFGTANGFTSVADGTTGSEGFFTMSAGPNPFSENANISFNIAGLTNKSVKLYLIGSNGETTTKIAQGSYSPGEHQLVLSSAGLSSGKYLLTAEIDNRVFTLPIVIVK